MIICYSVISMDIQIQGPGDAFSSNGPGFNSRKFVQLFGYHYWICSDLLYFWIFGCFAYNLSLVIVWVHPQFFLREYIKRNFVGYFSLVNLFCCFNLDVLVIYWSCSWDVWIQLLYVSPLLLADSLIHEELRLVKIAQYNYFLISWAFNFLVEVRKTVMKEDCGLRQK